MSASTSTPNTDLRLLTFSHVLRYLRDLNLEETLEAFELEAPSLFDDYRNHYYGSLPEKPLHAVIEEHLQYEAKDKGTHVLEDKKTDLILDAKPSGYFPKSCTSTFDSIHHANVLFVSGHLLPADTFSSDTLSTAPMRVLASSSTDRTVRISSFPDGRVLTILSYSSSPILNVAFHPLIPTLAGSVAMDGTLSVVDVSTGDVVQQWKEHLKYAVRCGFSPDGQWLVSASYDKTVRIYKCDPSSTQPAAEETVPDVVTGDPDLDALETKAPPPPHPTYTFAHTKTFRGAVEAITFLRPTDTHSYPTLVVATRDDHYLHYIGLTDIPPAPAPEETAAELHDSDPFPHLLYNLNSGDDIWVSFTAMDLSPHPSGTHILVHTDSKVGRLIIVRARAAGPVKSLYGVSVDGFGTYRCTWSPNGDYVYAIGDGVSTGDASTGGEVGVWEVRSGKLVARLQGHEGVVKAVGVVPSGEGEQAKGDVVVTCSFDRTIKVWEWVDGK
ncbi:WD40 repeat-like protein [Gonapodya prolifera JEL478]|uniref:WD40 repeat-like protein n=1 Tax=Gonapodya prolifera (strain JEL478) TaxID=1344416 RepID=A0A139A9B3_GONPJ|nr:WD40 repeat-like protein [Gonapodya prolifera JEL478]|eukprot:KXS13065.1 WD40 repeat-like protein [Gonapodya prolifera JEL478]